MPLKLRRRNTAQYMHPCIHCIVYVHAFMHIPPSTYIWCILHGIARASEPILLTESSSFPSMPPCNTQGALAIRNRRSNGGNVLNGNSQLGILWVKQELQNIISRGSQRSFKIHSGKPVNVTS